MLVACVAGVKKFQENCLDKNPDHRLKVTPEMQKEAIEYTDHQLKYNWLSGNRVAEQAITKLILNHVYKFFSEESLLRSFQYK